MSKITQQNKKTIQMSISANDRAALIGYYRMSQDYELIADLMGLGIDEVAKKCVSILINKL